MLPWEAILFDLDGTLVDTAPDLVGAVQDLARARGLLIPEFSLLRPWASHGAPGLLGAAFGVMPKDPQYPVLRASFLQIYQQRGHRQSRLFPGMEELLGHLDREHIPWGIVTNKSVALSQELLAQLALPYPPAVLVGGDSTAAAKPSPIPVQAALDLLNVKAQHCPLLGDDRRDMIAAQGAGCPAWAALWGYWQAEDPPESWEAQRLFHRPEELLSVLRSPPMS